MAIDTGKIGGRGSVREQLIVMLATVLVGALLYRPWVAAPFDLLDFSEFIPRLKAADSAWNGLLDLTRYYLGHGRFSPVAVASIVAKWWIFGDWTAGWQVLRVALLALIVRSGWLLYVKLGATRVGALLGCGVFFVAPTASPVWSRLSLGEPLGVFFVMWSANLAMDARGAPTASRSIQLAVLAVLLALTKEMMLVCLALPAALYLWPASSRGGFWKRMRFLWPTIGATAGVTVLLAWAYLQTTATGYAAEYGTTHSAIWEVIPPWLFSFFPFDPFAGGAPILFTIVTIAWLSVLAVGWRLYLTTASAEARAIARVFLAIALVMPALLALEYLPWPVFNRFYYFPALCTLGGLVAIAASGFGTTGKKTTALLLASVLAAYATGALQSRGTSDRAFAVRFAVAELVRYLGSAPPTDTLLIGARIVTNQKWQGLPETLHRYGPVLGVTLPPAEAATCEEGAAAAHDPRRNIAFVSFATACRAPMDANKVVKQSFTRFDFPSLRLVPDSVRIDVSLSPAVRG